MDPQSRDDTVPRLVHPGPGALDLEVGIWKRRRKDRDPGFAFWRPRDPRSAIREPATKDSAIRGPRFGTAGHFTLDTGIPGT